MNTDFRHRRLPGNSPLANVLVVVLGVVAIAISLVVGMVAFVAVAAAVIVLGAVVWIRAWWLGVRPGSGTASRPRNGRAGSSTSNERSVIEGSYHVIPGEKDDDSRPQT